MYNYNPNYYMDQNDDRFVGGIVAPLLLGGVAGYAIGNANQNNQSVPNGYMVYPYPYPIYYNNIYYPYPYNQ